MIEPRYWCAPSGNGLMRICPYWLVSMIQTSVSTRSNCLTISFQRWASSSFDNLAVATAGIKREVRAMLSNHRVFLALPPPSEVEKNFSQHEIVGNNDVRLT